MTISISVFNSTKVVACFLYLTFFKKPCKKKSPLALDWGLFGGHKPTEITVSSKNSHINVIDESDIWAFAMSG